VNRIPDDAGELVIGLVGPVGSNLPRLEVSLERTLARYGYRPNLFKLSELFVDERLGALFPELSARSAYDRLRTAMDAGDRLREVTDTPEIMAIHAASSIAAERALDDNNQPLPMDRTAHILHSLKRPEEVEFLRRLYGQRFVLISVYVPRERRIAVLREAGMSEGQAVELVARDERSDGRYGQETAAVFERADLFVDIRRNPEELEGELLRFFDLLFGSPLVTPRQAEHAMFLAFAASLRSGDLSRQVGAVLTTEDGTLIAEGANDAPRFGGGQYWPTDDDQRDLALGHDSNERIRRQMAQRILERTGHLDPARDVLEQAEPLFGDAEVLDITEFGRAVHAEMAALMACARIGVSTVGRRLYCTTFPCHNCAKHIVAAGVTQVMFIEAYPKSRALDLHRDAISLQEDTTTKVRFLPFVGIGPRRYVDLFALRDAYGSRIRRKGKDGAVARWDRASAVPALQTRLVTYLTLERRSTERLAERLARALARTIEGREPET
jgi:deoxycytidylate deaminase